MACIVNSIVHMNLSSVDTCSFLIEPDVLHTRTDDFLLIDIRGSHSYSDGHIPGAINLCSHDRFVHSTSRIGLNRFSRELLSFYTEAGVATSRPVVVYEETTSMRAARECWMLQYLGHPDVRMLQGGLQAWLAVGGELTDAVPASVPGAFLYQPQTDMVANIDGILSLSGRDHVTILDVRSHEEFTGTGGSACCWRRGRIPGAVRVEWTNFLDKASGRLKSSAAIQRVLQDANIPPDNQIIAYCHRGARSALVYCALKYSGCRRVKNYIGSWHEWAARSDTPVETGESTGYRS